MTNRATAEILSTGEAASQALCRLDRRGVPYKERLCKHQLYPALLDALGKNSNEGLEAAVKTLRKKRDMLCAAAVKKQVAESGDADAKPSYDSVQRPTKPNSAC